MKYNNIFCVPKIFQKYIIILIFKSYYIKIKWAILFIAWWRINFNVITNVKFTTV